MAGLRCLFLFCRLLCSSFKISIFSLTCEISHQRSYLLGVLEGFSSSSSFFEESIAFFQLSSIHSWVEFEFQSPPKKENVAKSFLFCLSSSRIINLIRPKWQRVFFILRGSALIFLQTLVKLLCKKKGRFRRVFPVKWSKSLK